MTPPDRSVLRHIDPGELHDLICVGFGPASLAIAVALHDVFSTTSGGTPPPRVAFFERQQQFAWHAGMLVPGATMQISFIKDLATLRNPKSEFTFLNYLHCRKRLVHFSNLGNFFPLRLEYEDYLRWCAGWFEEVVEYDQEVLDVTPGRPVTIDGKVNSFVVKSKNGTTGKITTCRSKHVVIAIGGKPRVPEALPTHPRIFHSSRYTRVIPALLKELGHPSSDCNGNGFVAQLPPLHIAVIGNGQSAAEIFNDLHSRCPQIKCSMLIKGAALRPSDDSPFVNEIFNPEYTDSLYVQPPEVRKAAIVEDKGTNYGVVRLELLERIYGTIYEQRIKSPDEGSWHHRILPFRQVTRVVDLPTTKRVSLRIKNVSRGFGQSNGSTEETLDVDAIFTATGYVRDAHEQMLRPAEFLRPFSEKRAESQAWHVERNYRVQFRPGSVSDDSGLWLQGCNEATHGLSDVLLSVLATRAGEVVESIFGHSLRIGGGGRPNGLEEHGTDSSLGSRPKKSGAINGNGVCGGGGRLSAASELRAEALGGWERLNEKET